VAIAALPLPLLLLFGVLAMSASAAPRGANTVKVTIQNFAFSPPTITIDPGDTVVWTNLDSASHSAITVQPGFISAVVAQNQSTTVTFDRAGTYDYICGIHGASMKGTVIVRGIALPTPVPTTGPPGHVVDNRFQEAFPDEVGGAASGNLFLFASGALGILMLARLAWVVRHW
jgi:plastocyanin